MPGADGTQARHWTDAAAEGKQKDMIQAKASLSTSRIPLWRFDTDKENICFNEYTRVRILASQLGNWLSKHKITPL